MTARAAVTVAVRPERMHLFVAGEVVGDRNVFDGRIEFQIFAGNLVHQVVRLADGSSVLVESRPGGPVGSVGDSIRIGWNVGDAVIIGEG